jgi:hypothetical protein
VAPATRLLAMVQRRKLGDWRLEIGDLKPFVAGADVFSRQSDGGFPVWEAWDFARLAECLPSLQHDPSRPEDVLKVDADEDGVGRDDAADALRYLVATKARTISVRKLRGL